ncbi:unnamed protein product [Bursaphelenchus xylophilus]|uniref:(pine wood nematode) hypothetical protein n=1 Tax=Bursaphelenchus xylophilus TaxID=6326 RepID=A0A1I7SAQ8_BURXY|nr:unnamed protein product [Bursaphelenchus xylophilus]CAG9126878.1 unnamed protein product [Bursaphelenchus xylophilus]
MQARLPTSVQKCVKCRQHRIIVPYKNHRNVCPYIDCKCSKCMMVDNYRMRYHRNKRRTSAECSESSSIQGSPLNEPSSVQNPPVSINICNQSPTTEPIDVSGFHILKIDPIPLRNFNIDPDSVQHSPLQEALLQALLAQNLAHSKTSFSTPTAPFLETPNTVPTAEINNTTLAFVYVNNGMQGLFSHPS